jgi:hypothetical protein
MKKSILILLYSVFAYLFSAAQPPTRVDPEKCFPLRVVNGHAITGTDSMYCDWTEGKAYAWGFADISSQPGQAMEQKVMYAGKAALTDARNRLNKLFLRTYFNHNFVLFDLYSNFPYTYRSLTGLLATAPSDTDTMYDNIAAVKVSVPLYIAQGFGLSVAALYCEVSQNVGSAPSPGSGEKQDSSNMYNKLFPGSSGKFPGNDNPNRTPEKGSGQTVPKPQQNSEGNQDLQGAADIQAETKDQPGITDKLLTAYIFPSFFDAQGNVLYNHSSLCLENKTSLSILPRNEAAEHKLDPSVKVVRCYADEFGRYMVYPDDYPVINEWKANSLRYVFFREFIMILN